MRRLLVLSCLVALLCQSAAMGALTVILTRHAEKAAQPADNPPLSPAGRQRAASLAAMLVDSGVDAIYVTEYLRTQQTAQPLASRLALEPQKIRTSDGPVLAQRLRGRSAGTVLVVGHSNTLPALIVQLGGPPVSIGEDDFDNVFVLTVTPNQTSYFHFHYGERPATAGSGRPKETVMQIEFVRSGGFVGTAAQVEGKVSLDKDGYSVSAGTSGYKRKLSVEECSRLKSQASAAMAETSENNPGELRDGYQYDVKISLDNGTTKSITVHGDSGGAAIASWVRDECDKIWQFRVDN